MLSLNTIVGILIAIFSVILTLSIALAAGIRFTRKHRKKYPWLKRLDGKQLMFLAFAVVSAILVAMLGALDRIQASQRSFQTIDLSEFDGDKALSPEFERELVSQVKGTARDATAFFQAAEVQFAARRYPDAAKLYKNSLDVLPTMSAYLNRGIALTLSGKRAEALSTFQDGLAMASRQQDFLFQANFLSNLAFEYADSGPLLLAETNARASLKLSQEHRLKRQEARALVLLATILEEKRQNTEAMDNANRGLTIYRSLKDKRGEATALATIGLLYGDADQVDQSLQNLKQALVLHQESGDVIGQIKVLYNLGIVLSNHGKLDAALENEQLALDMAKPEIAALDRANILGNMGTLYWRQHKIAQGELYEEEALKTYRELDSQPGIASALNDLGILHADNGKLDEAAQEFSEAATTFHILSEPAEESMAAGNAAEILRRQKKYREALVQGNQALGIAEKANYNAGIANALGTLGLTYSALNKFEDARSALRRAIELSERYGFTLDQIDDYKRELNKLNGVHHPREISGIALPADLLGKTYQLDGRS